MINFEVLNNDGSIVDFHSVCKEEWAKNLLPFDIDGFWISECGQLILMDDCCNVAYPPPDRFKVEFLEVG